MGEDAETKKIARLDFDVKNAINNLDIIDKKLKSIAESSNLYAKQIGKNIGSSFDFSKVLNVDSFSQQLSKVTNISEAQAKKLVANIMKNEQDITAKKKIEQEKRQTAIIQNNAKQLTNEAKRADKEILINSEKNARIEIDNNRHANKMEEINARQANSVKTLYDKITNYANTYLIYQGFNALKKGIKETIDEMVEVEQQMVAIDRVMNVAGMNIDKFRDKLIQLASDYGNSFDNVADVSLRLAQAGIKSEANLKLTEKTLLALNTAELDATQATDDMVAVMSQWNLITGSASEQSEQYGAIIDKINKVADNFPTTSADIMDALKKTSSAFKLAGADINETIATIVAAEKASQRGGKVIGTALSNITQQLKAEKKLELAEQLGLNFFKDAKKTEFRPIMEIFQEMSDRMAALKNQGKESSTEMQKLLEMFTVFRRNIGASLLGEMEGGEESTYMQVYKTAIDSAGYSLQENAKYMATAKAAQEQFNAELLKLKTQIWEGGLEDVYRGMLQTGNDLIQGLSKLIDKFGLIPTAIGAITAAYTVLNNKVKIQDIVALTKRVSAINKVIEETGTNLKADDKLLEGTSQSFKKYVMSVDNGKVSLGGYAKQLVTSSIKTAALTAATIALNAAISVGLSLAVTAIASAIDNWIHAEEKAIEKNNELKQKAQDTANEINEEVKTIQDLTKEYKDFSNTIKNSKDKNKLIDPDNVKKAYELQTKINDAIKDSGKQVELVTETTNKHGEKVQKVNKKYEEQLNLLRTIAFEKKQEEARELKTAMEAARRSAEKTKVSLDEVGKIWEFENLGSDFKTNFGNIVTGTTGKQLSSSMFENSYYKLFDSASIKEQMDILLQTKQLLEDSGQTGSKAYEIIEESLKTLKDEQKKVQEATEAYKDSLSELYAMSGQVDVFDTALKSIADSYSKIKGPNKLIKDIQGINQQFREGKINIEEYFNNLQDQIDKINFKAKGEELEAYQAIFAATTETIAEGLEQLISGFESGTINFADYSSGIQEAAENTLDLYTKQNKLQNIDGIWKNAAGAVDEYANSLQNALNGMNELTELMPVIAENYDYIAQHANEAGEAAFKQSDRASQAYKNLANDVANSLNVMRTDNNEAYVAITEAVLRSTKKITNEQKNANNWINRALLSDANALNAALNESANQLATSTSKVTSSLGNVISALGNAISHFDYKITATPFKEGNFGITTNEFGLPTGVELPHFGFKLTGEGGSSIQGLSSALKTFGSDLQDYSTSKFRYTTLKSTVGDYTGSSPSFRNTPSKTPSKTPKTGGKDSKKQKKEEKKKKEEEKKKKEYEKRLKYFTNTIEKMETKEEEWVNKQKELGLLSNSDMVYVTQRRIKEYEKYLDKIKNATWMNKEDRKKLQDEYNKKLKEAQLDYFKYLKTKLDDEVKAEENARDKKIKALEEETDKKIELLKKQREAERDTNERQEILDDIAYWEQRTGREAVENLAEARKKLAEFDRDAQIEAQIEALEENEKRQKASIERQAQTKIDALKKVYDENVKAFSESNKIIYDNSVISAKNLYNAYKKNFVDPLNQQLKFINKKNVNYTVKKGDTLESIAKEIAKSTKEKTSTIIKRIKSANSSLKNTKNTTKLKKGLKIKIPMFHQGGIFNGTEEGLALLKKGEWVLRPEWSNSLNRMMKYFDNATQRNINPINNNSKIEVSGNLVNIQANVRNQSDIDAIGQKVEKILRDKFNIKK